MTCHLPVTASAGGQLQPTADLTECVIEPARVLLLLRSLQGQEKRQSTFHVSERNCKSDTLSSEVGAGCFFVRKEARLFKSQRAVRHQTPPSKSLITKIVYYRSIILGPPSHGNYQFLHILLSDWKGAGPCSCTKNGEAFKP